MSFCSQYLTGLFTGGAVGWALSWLFHDQIVNFVSLAFTQDTENIGDTEGLTDGNAPPKQNIIYLNLTNEALEKFLASGTLASHLAETQRSREDTVDQEAMPSVTPTLAATVDDGEELTNIFESETARQTRSVKETLALGTNLGTQPISFPTSVGGGYVTLGQLSEMDAKNTEFKNKTLSRGDEMELMNLFRGIIGMPLTQAQIEVAKQGYTVHVLYVGMGEKMPAQKYCGTVIGVRVTDEKYSAETKTLSHHATVNEIIDIGGMDLRDRGKIRV